MGKDLSASAPEAGSPRISRRGHLLLLLARMLDDMDALGISGPAALKELAAREMRPTRRVRGPRGSA